MSRPKLIIFAKAPRIGKAKTRLAADIGKTHAWRHYRAMTAQILRNVTGEKWDTVLAVTPVRFMGQVPAWAGFWQYAQVTGSLSPRLVQAFSSKGPIVVIGSDSPQVTRADIDQAFRSIKTNNFVFGPADDGGFWLMGAMGPLPEFVFENVRWSSENTLADLQSNLAGDVVSLRTLTDIDNLAALRLWKNKDHD